MRQPATDTSDVVRSPAEIGPTGGDRTERDNVIFLVFGIQPIEYSLK